MSLEDLKSKLHVIFEHCGMQHDESVEPPIEIKGMVKEDSIPAVGQPSVASNPTLTPPPATTQPNKNEFTLKSGIVVNISLDQSGNLIVKKQDGTDAKDIATPEELNAMKVQLGAGTVQPSQTIQPSQPKSAVPEPAEAPVAEGAINEINKEVLQKFIDQYGAEEGKKIYYATANKQGRSEETFKK